jgi:serine/threonine protein kinase
MERRMIGQILNNRYKIISQLGEGGMGEVYLATDEKSNQQVAVKILARQLTASPEALERFKREGETLRQLDHPNIVKFIDAFEHDKQYVIVMEYVSGGNLQNLIKQGALPIEQARQITLDLCDALIRAHRLNIIHRDLKPENVLITEKGIPKLADFGVARLSESTSMTRSGTQVGTPYYMSPEAWEGRTLDAQADIWSLGVVLFEMFTGQVPFGGDTGAAVMNKVLTTPPPDLKKMRAEVSPALSKIVSRMLTRDKKRRYQTMRQVAVDLESEEQAIPKKPAQPTRIVSIIGVLLIVGILLVINLSPRFVNSTPNTQLSTAASQSPVSPTQFPTATATPEPAAAQSFFRDDFDGVLAEGWFWQNETPSHWNLTAEHGWLEMTVLPGRIKDGDYSNLLLRFAPGGNFRLETRLNFSPISNFQFAGLIVYQSDVEFLQAGRAYCEPSDLCVGEGLYFDNYINGVFQADNFAAVYREAEVYLRLERQNDLYTLFASANGTDWDEIGSQRNGLNPLLIGLTTGQNGSNPLPARFDYFQVTQLP